MSRIGKLPISIPAGVTVAVSDDNVVTVKGKISTPSSSMLSMVYTVHWSITWLLAILRVIRNRWSW